MSIEDPDADRREQLQSVGDDDAEDFELGDPPLDANPADVAEQHRLVPFDDDVDY
jgi:hypothetical protein